MRTGRAVVSRLRSDGIPSPSALLSVAGARFLGSRRRKPLRVERTDDFSVQLMKKKMKAIERLPQEGPTVASEHRPDQERYKNLVFKWLLEAYPESLSRQEIAGRLGAAPVKVRNLIVRPLVEEGKIFKWGTRTVPYERYMPNVKAPEYYEATGESMPLMPDVDESEFRLKMLPRSRQPPENENVVNEESEDATGPEAAEASEGEGEGWNWDELYEEDEEDEAEPEIEQGKEEATVENDVSDDDDWDSTETEEATKDGEDSDVETEDPESSEGEDQDFEAEPEEPEDDEIAGSASESGSDGMEYLSETSDSEGGHEGSN